MPGSHVLYDARLMTRVPRHIPTLVSTAAAHAFISPSAYVRAAIAERLERDGYAPSAGRAPQRRTPEAA